LSGSKSGVFAWERLAGNGDDPVTVMIVQKVCEGLLANKKGGMLAAVPARGFG
jgi:hypothetical protein